MWLTYWYLRTLLFFGFSEYVYSLSDRWGSDPQARMPRRYNAAAEIQNDLVKQGYFLCLHCEWATKEQDEHIKKGEGYCYEQTTEFLNQKMLLDQLGEDPMTWQ